MSSRNGAPIDFQAWAQNQIVKRTEAALKERDAAFAERHAETPLPQLARYLHRCSLSLGHSPSPNEVDGGSFIEERFGSWETAMRLAKLPLPTSMRKLKDTARYKQEKVRQEPLAVFRAKAALPVMPRQLVQLGNESNVNTFCGHIKKSPCNRSCVQMDALHLLARRAVSGVSP